MPQPGKISKRRLLSLIATAAVASGAGIALGSTFRFQVVSVGKTPLFTPQQDFPPLAEWPPQIPSPTEHDDLTPTWDSDTPQSQLVYNDRLATQSYNDESYDDSEEFSSEWPEEIDDAPDVIDGAGNVEEMPQARNDEAFEVNDIPSDVVEDIETFDSSPDSVGALSGNASSIDGAEALPDSHSWFDKRPMSESDFIDDGPVIILPPTESTSSPDTLQNRP